MCILAHKKVEPFIQQEIDLGIISKVGEFKAVDIHEKSKVAPQ